MTYPKYCKNRRAESRGMILADILLAFALGSVFVVILAESSESARNAYERAQVREQSLDRYQIGNFIVSTRPYGNDRVETTSADASNTMSFRHVSMRPFQNLWEAAGTPLCAVDFNMTSSVLPLSAPAVVAIRLPLDPLLPLTDLEVRHGLAYLSADSNISADPDLIVADIHDNSHAQIVSTLNTGPGVRAIAIAGKRIYAAAASTAAQLHVIRLDSLNAPTLEARFKLPLPQASTTPPLASSIFYDRGNVYLGTEKWEGDEFNIIDVTNPLGPRKIGGLEVGNKVEDIFSRSGSTYLATAGQSELELVDAHDPVNPVVKGAFSPSGWQRQDGTAISIFEDALGFGRTSGGFNFTSDPESFTWATTSTTTFSSPISHDIPGGVYGLVMDRSNVYLATRQVDKELQIFSRSGSSTDPIATLALPVAPQAMTCDREHLYILANNAPVIYEITFK